MRAEVRENPAFSRPWNVDALCTRREDERRLMPPRKVLVVDDSKLLHRMFEMMLRQYPLVHAYDGKEALQRLSENGDVDLVLLDMNMPRMSGLELLEAMKADAAMKKIPVVLVTTEGSDEQTQRGLKAGAAAYVKKPFKNEELIAVVQRLTSAA
jgi:two-component system, chemotaxis family, chemotaxis protein CheY